MSDGFPVYVVVGNTKTRVGTAHKYEDGFSIAFGGLSIGATPDAPSTQRRASSGDSGGARLPNFGRSAGGPVYGASMRDLTFYQGVLAKNVEDESKARWRDQNQATLDAIEAEIHRQNGGAGSYMPPEPNSGRGPEDDGDLIPF
jgi:hypothetical protein